jgi:hypothetical protein
MSRSREDMVLNVFLALFVATFVFWSAFQNAVRAFGLPFSWLVALLLTLALAVAVTDRYDPDIGWMAQFMITVPVLWWVLSNLSLVSRSVAFSPPILIADLLAFVAAVSIALLVTPSGDGVLVKRREGSMNGDPPESDAGDSQRKRAQ